MSTRAASTWLAVAVFVLGLVIGLMPVHAGGASCGSAFAAGDKTDVVVAQFSADLAGDNINVAASCDDRRGAQQMFAIGLLVIGGLVGGFLLLTARSSSSDQSPRAV